MAGWLGVALALLALRPPHARAADVMIEEVWDRAEEAARRGPRALLFTGSLVAATALGSAFVAHQRTRDLRQCRFVAGCTDLDGHRDRQLHVRVATGVLSIAAVTLLVSGWLWLAQRKRGRTEATPAPRVTTPLVLRW